jgi:hypothetical protein
MHLNYHVFQHISAREIRRKLNRMTIIVGMVGSDGIVLAADQRMVRNASRVDELDDISSVRKIVLLADHQIAYAAAGDEVSWEVGSSLSKALDAGRFKIARIRESLESIGDEVFNELRARICSIYTDQDEQRRRLFHLNEPVLRSIVVVFYGDTFSEPELWALSIDPVRCFAHRLSGIAIRGAIGNTARFFGRYFLGGKSVSSLKFMAAHIVLSAGEIDRLMIDGLQVVAFKSGLAVPVESDELRALQERSRKLDRLIQSELERED